MICACQLSSLAVFVGVDQLKTSTVLNQPPQNRFETIFFQSLFQQFLFYFQILLFSTNVSINLGYLKYEFRNGIQIKKWYQNVALF